MESVWEARLPSYKEDRQMVVQTFYRLEARGLDAGVRLWMKNDPGQGTVPLPSLL